MLEKILESLLDYKEIKSVTPTGNQPWMFFGRTVAEAEALVLWPADAKNWFTGKDPDTIGDWRQEKGPREDEMVGWHYWLDGHEFEQAPEVGDGLGSLACCSPWGWKELDMTEWLNWTEMNIPERPSGFCYFHQFKPEFCNVELKIWVAVSSGFCFCWLV